MAFGEVVLQMPLHVAAKGRGKRLKSSKEIAHGKERF